MKPTLQQEEILKAYLTDILKYRETIDEVYDHVLSAVEAKPKNIKFQDAVNDILNDDFGGGNGLVKMEKQHLKDATWEGFVSIARYIKADFKFPNIIYTIALFGTLLYTISHVNIFSGEFTLVYPASLALFTALMWIRQFFVGYYTGNTKSSTRDVIVAKISFPIYWFGLFLSSPLTHKSKVFTFLITDHPQLISGIITLYLLYLMAIIKICRDEFKPYFAK